MLSTLLSELLNVRRVAALRRSHSTRAIVGVRREDKNQWERRVPLAPSHVRSLVDDGVEVHVQTSTRRVFSDVEFERAGARIVDDLSKADVILGVKEVPIPQLVDGKTYVMFSHTHKGQPYNMPMLKTVLDRNVRLIDYELLKDRTGQRVVRFGTYAGYAGMVDFLHGLGQRLLTLGYSTPFLNVGMTYIYRNLAATKVAIESIGLDIARWGLPSQYGPMVFVFSGDGYVSRGAQEIFEQLPHQYIKPNDLKHLVESNSLDPKLVYGVIVREADYLEPVTPGGKFDRDDYMKNPNKYQSVFHKKIAPYMSVLVNCIYWEAQFPRLLTRSQAAELARTNPRFLGVADISCDVEGSVEFTDHVTSIEKPFFVYDTAKRVNTEGTKGDGVLVMAVDNLPAEMARESSLFFGSALVGFVRELANNKLSETLQNAVIAEKGKLAPSLEKRLTEAIAIHGGSAAKAGSITAASKPKRRVLLLGAGMVAKPVVDHLCAFNDTSVTVASLDVKEAKALVQPYQNNGCAVALDVKDTRNMNELIAHSDVVISLVPATMHAAVAELCIDNKKDMVTASYISPAMQALHQRAVSQGVTILNEIGLDPGIDHLSAIKTINAVHTQGGKIRSFFSVCGGLPAPEASDNALGYKFSWSPRGVLSAGLNPSQFLYNGGVKQTAQGDLFKHAVPLDIGYVGFPLEYLPNRNSLQYQELYGIPEAKNVCRGTLRYQGFSDVMQVVKEMGLLELASHPAFSGKLSWRDAVAKVCPNFSIDFVRKSLPGKSADVHRKVFDAVHSLGLLSTQPIDARDTPIDTLCALLAKTLVYGPNERDMVIMQHHYEIIWDANRVENRKETLIDYGVPGGYTSMAKTVGLPAAIAADLILNGVAKRRGVIAPMTADLYEPLLKQLDAAGIRFTQSHSFSNAPSATSPFPVHAS